ncbi:MAG: NHLP bacteriocin export ABC transporter permease/ATPase subunit [Clostridiales bacterium]|jgi:ATP-binding cassette subfamily C protein|nr:NHLP bacteriocin export ABC transporter permease/ATPase subunit [Clostridiales bacterium]
MPTKLKLKGGDTFYADSSGKSYAVISGTALVFLASRLESGDIERKHSLADAVVGERIPALSISDPEAGRWMFVISALEEAELSEEEGSEAAIAEFSKKIGVQAESPDEFAMAVVEMINLRLVKDEAYIYATLEEQKATETKGLETVYRVFDQSDPMDIGESSGNALYDALAFLCSKRKIRIEPFDKIKEACGRRFAIEDISRVSHFNIREVVLEEGWFKQDSGALLAFKGGVPVVCVPKGPSKYIMHNLSERSSQPVDAACASALEPKAWMAYEPFPNKSLSSWDLIAFGLKSVFKHDIANLLLFFLIGAAIGLLLPYLNQVIFDDFIPMSNQGALRQTCFLILSLTIGNLAFSIVKNLASLRASTAMAHSVQCAMFDRLFTLPNSFFSDYSSADLAKRVMGVSSILSLLSETVLTSVLTAVFSLMYLFRMRSYSKTLTIAGIAMVLANMGITLLFGWLLSRHEKRLVELKAKMSSMLYQTISGIAKVRIAGVENRMLLNYIESLAESKRALAKRDSLSNISSSVNMFLDTAFTAVFYYLLVSGSLNVSFGQFFGFVSAFGFFSGAMIRLVTMFLAISHALPTYQRAKPILSALPETSSDAMLPPKELEGSIEVINLSFKYKESDKDMVLSNVSFKIEKGEYVGIVGSSGSGKSTLLKLLLGFEKPTVGKVYYDAKDIDQLDKRELRKRFGVVLQDGQLISGSIFENIAIAGVSVTLERVKEAVRMVGLEEDIAQMPMGLHTMISDGAGTISGGQKQRMLIARSIVGNPSVLFFDEATSALDNANQALVCESLERLKTTRLVIAHRLSTVEKCDKLIVLDNGRVVETGTYQELLAKRGHFYALVANQMT